MSDAFAIHRTMMAVEKLLAATPSWGDLEQQFAPAQTAQNFEPDRDLKMSLAALASQAHGGRIVEWLLDLTTRAPYPHVGQTADSVVLAAAKHEARAAIGWVLLRAIADGAELWKQKMGDQP